MSTREKREWAIDKVREEFHRAVTMHDPFHTAHEGYAVILEELDELKAEIWKRKSLRDNDQMIKEAIQVAAMALRFIVDVCWKDLNAKRAGKRGQI